MASNTETFVSFENITFVNMTGNYGTLMAVRNSPDIRLKDVRFVNYTSTQPAERYLVFVDTFENSTVELENFEFSDIELYGVPLVHFNSIPDTIRLVDWYFSNVRLDSEISFLYFVGAKNFEIYNHTMVD